MVSLLDGLEAKSPAFLAFEEQVARAEAERLAQQNLPVPPVAPAQVAYQQQPQAYPQEIPPWLLPPPEEPGRGTYGMTGDPMEEEIGITPETDLIRRKTWNPLEQAWEAYSNLKIPFDGFEIPLTAGALTRNIYNQVVEPNPRGIIQGIIGGDDAMSYEDLIRPLLPAQSSLLSDYKWPDASTWGVGGTDFQKQVSQPSLFSPQSMRGAYGQQRGARFPAATTLELEAEKALQENRFGASPGVPDGFGPATQERSMVDPSVLGNPGYAGGVASGRGAYSNARQIPNYAARQIDNTMLARERFLAGDPRNEMGGTAALSYMGGGVQIPDQSRYRSVHGAIDPRDLKLWGGIPINTQTTVPTFQPNLFTGVPGGFPAPVPGQPVASVSMAVPPFPMVDRRDEPEQRTVEQRGAFDLGGGGGYGDPGVGWA